VLAGDLSRQIQSVLAPAELHLVDLFEGHVTSGDHNGQNMRCIHMPTRMHELGVEFSQAGIHASDSVAWLRSMPETSLDWVYLDTNHEYDQTLAELHAAWVVVRGGGMITGHDFSSAFPGVTAAVREFCQQIKRPYRVYDGDLLPSFAIEV
jgi:hypothetical protein